MKRIIILAAIALGIASSGAIAAEYQGKVIDGIKLPATASSLETGGVFDIQVKFRGRRATLYFENGNRQSIRLDRRVIVDPKAIEGFGRPFNVNLGGFFNIGLSDGRDLTNLEPTIQRQFEGHWQISLSDEALELLQQEGEGEPSTSLPEGDRKSL